GPSTQSLVRGGRHAAQTERRDTKPVLASFGETAGRGAPGRTPDPDPPDRPSGSFGAGAPRVEFVWRRRTPRVGFVWRRRSARVGFVWRRRLGGPDRHGAGDPRRGSRPGCQGASG